MPPNRWPSGKTSASRAVGQFSVPPFAVDLLEVESYQWLKTGTPVATLPGPWRYWVSAGAGWPGVSIL